MKSLSIQMIKITILLLPALLFVGCKTTDQYIAGYLVASYIYMVRSDTKRQSSMKSDQQVRILAIKLYQQGIEDYVNFNYKGAIKKIGLAINSGQFPKEKAADGHMYRAASFYILGQHDKIYVEFSKILSINPRYWPPFIFQREMISKFKSYRDKQRNERYKRHRR